MSATMLRFSGNLMSEKAANELCNYQPPRFPPPNNFYISVDKDGNPLSTYSDDYWNFSAYGFSGFNFKKQNLSPENLDLLKQVIFLYLYHNPLFPRNVASIRPKFVVLSILCRFADTKSIRIDRLYRHPQMAKNIVQALTSNKQNIVIGVLSELLRVEAVLGWKIADAEFLSRLSRLQIPHIRAQNAYIPPRIWMALIQSTERVMDTFEQHEAELFDAVNSLSDAYRHNNQNGYWNISPFSFSHCKSAGGNAREPRRNYAGGSSAFIEDRGLAELLNRWVGYLPSKNNGLFALIAYLNLVRDCAFTYILAHSIQRVGEGLSLRADCFITDDDPTMGKVAMLVGETTKTDPDSDARWVVPMQVKRAVTILESIARLRINSSLQPIAQEAKENPCLMTASIEPWSNVTVLNVSGWGLDKVVTSNPLAFDASELNITDEDYKIAYQLTPRLKEKDWFEVGSAWSFNAHQLRRTLAVNLFASDVDESVIQWLMKHKTVQQSYYYGRNYTRLKVNRLTQDAVLIESYRTTTRMLIDAAENSLGDNVHPTGKILIEKNSIKLIEEKKYKKLEALAKKGEIAARPTLLGLCMTQSCGFGGVESAVHCAGVDGKGPCKDAIFSKRNGKRLQSLYDRNAEELRTLVENTPRHSKLKAENEAIEVYFHVTTTDR